jgi:hypothetical protein
MRAKKTLARQRKIMEIKEQGTLATSRGRKHKILPQVHKSQKIYKHYLGYRARKMGLKPPLLRTLHMLASITSNLYLKKIPKPQ